MHKDEEILRRMTTSIFVGEVPIGSRHPVVIQSMTNTDTRDVIATVKQIKELTDLGCKIVRIAVPDEDAASKIKEITDSVNVPIIADIHFDYKLALTAIENGIQGLRINPGNIGEKYKVEQVVKACSEKNIPIRIGVNAGSLEKIILEKYGGPTADAMVESALKHIEILEALNYDLIKVSLKSSDIPMMINAYKKLANKVAYPFHIGVTEAGTVNNGTIKSAVGIGALLAAGIGDTIRVSLTGSPLNEIPVAKSILKSLGLFREGLELISCPTCGRCNINLESVADQVEKRLANLDQPLKVAIMGCVVNGPGEAREADIGIAGGKGEGLLFKKGKPVRKIPENMLVEQLLEEIDKMK